MSTTTFAALGCTESYLRALDGRGFTTPTPVQAACFAPGLEGRDLLVQSCTGSGKTLAFGLPLLHRLEDRRGTQSLILAPTRELAQQVAEELKSVEAGLDVALLVGGLSYVPQHRALRHGAEVVVGTPGRVIDHLEQGTLDLSGLRMVVLDECDEMLNMGFIEDVEKILAKAPAGFQTYLFSATLPGPIAGLAKKFLKDPVRIQLLEGVQAQHADIAHTPCLVADHLHVQALVNILLHDEPSAALIFAKTKQGSDEVAQALRDAGLAADCLHGDLGQATRNRIMGAFKEGRLRYLVATDVAARGIDVEAMPLVVHLGIPTQMEPYVHRSGRTGRAGAKGASLALVGFKESRILMAWARRGGLKLDWRAVPTPDEIRVVRQSRLSEHLSGAATVPLRETARMLLETRGAEDLVANLLAQIHSAAHEGFHLPDPPKRESRSTPDRPHRDKREGERPWKPRVETPREDRPASRPWKARTEENGKEQRPWKSTPKPAAAFPSASKESAPKTWAAKSPDQPKAPYSARKAR